MNPGRAAFGQASDPCGMGTQNVLRGAVGCCNDAMPPPQAVTVTIARATKTRRTAMPTSCSAMLNSFFTEGFLFSENIRHYGCRLAGCTKHRDLNFQYITARLPRPAGSQ